MAQLTDEALKEITNYLEIQGLKWAQEYIAGRKAWLQAKGIRATGELIASLQTEVLSTLEGAARTRVELAFNEYGRYVEMRRLHAPAGGSDYILSLEKWIEQKGLLGKMTANYIAKRNVRQVPPSILNQLAWSVAISRHERVKRRRQWYSKSKSASITELFNQVAANLPELVVRELKAAFKQ